MENRLYYLDNLKGFLIILVILGHAIQFTIPDYKDCFTFRLIYSFHMPLFLFISGYLAKKGCYKHSVINVIKKRAIQLLLPLVIWAFLSPILKYGTVDVNKALTAIEYPDNGLWFLYNLFFYSVAFSLAEWLHEKTKVNLLFYIICAYLLFIVLMAVFHTRFNCTQLCYHFVFFALGYLYKEIDKTLSIRFVVWGGVIYACLVPFWTGREPLFYDYINLGGGFAYLFRYGVQILGMLFFYEIGKRFLEKKLLFVSKYGTMTLGVYAIHFTLLSNIGELLPIQTISIKIIIETILVAISCYILVKLIKRIPIIKTLLIGEI